MIALFTLTVNHYPILWLASALSFALGLVIGPVFIASNTIVHVTSDEKMRGKIFSSLEIVIHFAFLTSMLASAKLAEYVPRVYILVGVGCLFAVIGMGGLIRYRKGGDLAFLTDKMHK